MDADIVDRLRDSVRACRALDRSALLAEAADAIERLQLTDAEREAIRRAAAAWAFTRVGLPEGGVSATLRNLLKRLSPQPYQEPDEKRGVSDTRSPPPEWMTRPYWVDPPQGWRYGFPRLYDPAKDGDMTAWLIAHGYPEHLANKGLACTFTAAE
ncbi:MAG: hypothetical protein FJ286_16940 [Planctomycetes bacterium]|nr:hypothetical protein [Planctomycetota bacterium]